MVDGRSVKANGEMCVHCKEFVCKDERACFARYAQQADAAAARARQSLTFVLVAVVPTDDRQACIACSGLRIDRELRAIDDGRVWASFHAACLGTVRDLACGGTSSVASAVLTTGQAIVLAAARHWYRERHGGNVLTKELTAIALDDAVHQLETGSAHPTSGGTDVVEVERLREKLRQVEDECTQAIALKVKEHAITWRVLDQVRLVLHIENTNEDVVVVAGRLRARCAELEELNRLGLKTVAVCQSRIRYLEAVGPAPSAAVAAIVEAVVRADLAGAWEVCPDEGDPTQLCSHEACDVSRALRAWQAMPGAGAGTEGVAKSLQARVRMQRKELAALTRTLIRARQRFADEDKRLRAKCEELEMQVETYAEVVDIEQSLRQEGERLDAIEECNRLRARCEELEAELASPGWSSERDLCVEELRQRIGGDLIELQRRGEKECPLPQTAAAPSPSAAGVVEAAGIVEAAVRYQARQCHLYPNWLSDEGRALFDAVITYQAALKVSGEVSARREEDDHAPGGLTARKPAIEQEEDATTRGAVPLADRAPSAVAPPLAVEAELEPSCSCPKVYKCVRDRCARCCDCGAAWAGTADEEAVVPGPDLPSPSAKDRCVVCLKEDPGGLGCWVGHASLDCTPVHNGPCFATYTDVMRRYYAAAHPSPLRALRTDGWMVAAHNDYRLGGKQHTFWLFTRDGRAVKGEGPTDEEALRQVIDTIDGSSQTVHTSAATAPRQAVTRGVAAPSAVFPSAFVSAGVKVGWLPDVLRVVFTEVACDEIMSTIAAHVREVEARAYERAAQECDSWGDSRPDNGQYRSHAYAARTLGERIRSLSTTTTAAEVTK